MRTKGSGRGRGRYRNVDRKEGDGEVVDGMGKRRTNGPTEVAGSGADAVGSIL